MNADISNSSETEFNKKEMYKDNHLFFSKEKQKLRIKIGSNSLCNGSMNDKEIKLVNSSKDIGTIEVSNESSSCHEPSLNQSFVFINSDIEDNTKIASIATKKFQKRKRLMTNIDKVNKKSRFSPDKKKASNKWDSIKDFEFDAFFNAYEEHSKGKANNKDKSNSVISSNEGGHSANAKTSTNSPFKSKKLKSSAFRKMSAISSICNDAKAEQKSSKNDCQVELKASKFKRNSFYYQSTKYAIPPLSNDLSSIVS